jgi:hypothetical protein
MLRESKQENDLFFICSLIENIGRTTKNKRIDVINAIGEHEISKIYKLADVYHCEPLEKTTDDLITRFNISVGDFDNVGKCKYNVPSVFDIGKVYKRLVIYASSSRVINVIPALFNVYSSPVAAKIDDYNSSTYYESPQYLEQFYDLDNPPDVYEH